jgi:hypothetical protein
MLTLNISDADIELARYERISNPVTAIRKRMDAIYWTSQGKGRDAVSCLSGVHRNTVKNYIKIFNAGGMCALTAFHYKGFDSVLMKSRGTLEEYFRQHTLPERRKRRLQRLRN